MAFSKFACCNFIAYVIAAQVKNVYQNRLLTYCLRVHVPCICVTELSLHQQTAIAVLRCSPRVCVSYVMECFPDDVCIMLLHVFQIFVKLSARF